MKHYLDLVPISVKIHRKQSRMARICITLAVFLVAVMFGLADMYLQGVTNKQLEDSGNWHYQFHSIDAGTAAFIAARPEVEVCGWHKTVSSEAGYMAAGEPVAISAQDKELFGDILLDEVTEGRYPDSVREIAVPAFWKDSAAVSLDDTIGISKPDGSVAHYLVVGFLGEKDTARLMEEDGSVVVMTPEAFAKLSEGQDTMVSENFMVQFTKRCSIPNVRKEIKVQNQISDEQITENTPLLNIQGQLEGRTGVNQIYQVAFILALIVMLTCILMISSSLNSNVARRTEFFGSLRCLGATKKQIMRVVRHEGLYWCRTAIPLGLVLSAIMVWGLSAAMRVISPQWFSSMPLFGISWISMIASTLLGLLTVLLAARSPAKRAAKVSPLTAVSGNAGQSVRFRKAANTQSFKIETALGIHHARAKKRNYILMTGAFALCITLFLAFSTLIDFMENAFVLPEYTPELSIVSKTNTCSIEEELLEKVKQNGEVKRAYGRMFAYDVQVKNGKEEYNTNLISYEENQFHWSEDSLVSGSIETVMQQEDQVLAVQSENADIQLGDQITVLVDNLEHIVTVAGILSDSPLAREEGTEAIICSERTFTSLTGEKGYTIIDVQFENRASDHDLKDVEKIFSDEDVEFTEHLTRIQQQRNLYYAFAVLVYGFLLIIVAITVFHIMNTINMGVSAKMREYGAMRAIGMSNRQLVKMVMAEAATYAVSGIVLGCVVGLPIHWVIFVSLITNFWGISWGIPFIPLGLIIMIVLCTSFLSVRNPAKRLQEMSIIENINTQ